MLRSGDEAGPARGRRVRAEENSIVAIYLIVIGLLGLFVSSLRL